MIRFLPGFTFNFSSLSCVASFPQKNSCVVSSLYQNSKQNKTAHGFAYLMLILVAI